MKKTTLLVGSTFVAMAASLAQPAFAQDAAATTTAAPAPACADTNNDGICDSQEASQGEDGAIVVVGSHLRSDNFNSPSPVQVITREETTAAGFNTTTEALQGTAVTGGSSQINNAFGGYVTNGGPGANTLSLRGLGATRTLILLNGRRLAPAGTRGSVGSADLNVLPSAMVERFEVLKDGASSIYGSDAIAGVVNIVTRNNINGVIGEAQWNVPEIGAGISQRYALVAGTTSDRFSVSGSIEYMQRSAVTLGDTDLTSCQTSYRLSAAGAAPDSGSFIDPRTGKAKCYPTGVTGEAGTTINTIGTSSVAAVPAAGAVTTVFNRLRPNAAVTTGVVGYEGVGGGTNNLGVRDTFDPAMYQQSLWSPARTLTAYLNASYDTGALGDAELYVEGLYSHRESSQVSYRQLTLDYMKNSPLIPANLRFSTFSTATAVSNGALVGVRAFIGFGNTHSSQEVDFTKVGGGLRGNFLFDGWRYDLYVGSTWNDASYTMESFLTSRVAQSLNVVSDGAGGYRCVDTSNGCVAAPALTPAVVSGNLPAAYRNFILQEVTGNTKYDEQVVNFSIDGSLFHLPYGDVQAAFGLEYRHAHINDVPGIEMQNSNLYNLTSAGITRGSDAVKEAYAELEIPVFRNLPFAQDLTLNLSARVTDYRSYGTDWTYKIGGIYTPVSWLSFRGTYGTSYRAPALYEQYLSPTSGFLSSSADPCNNWGALTAGSIRRTNCASEISDPNFQATTSVTVLQQGGATTNLAAETSKNWTVGLILQPNFGSGFGDLSLAVDYYDIKVSNGVSRAGGSNILSLCYDDPDFRNGGGFCRLVTRAAGSNALTVNDSYVNLSTDIVRGIDYTLRYSRDIGTARFRFNANVTQYLEQSSKLFADDPLDDVNGTIGAPEFTGTFDLSLQWKGWRVRYGLEWIDGMDSTEYLGLDPATSTYIFKVDDYFTHNLSVQWIGDDFGITVGVRNMFNADLPLISSGAYNRVGNAPLYSGYDYIGRTFFVNVTTNF